MKFTIGGIFRSWSYHEHVGTSVFVPFSLRIAVLATALYAVSTVVLAAFENLNGGSPIDRSVVDMIQVTIFHFFVPFLISYCIVADRPIARPLILVLIAAVGWRLVSTIGWERLLSENPLALFATTITVFAAATWWLYRSAWVSFYFLEISGKMVPPHLEERRSELSRPRQFEQKLSKVTSYTYDYLEYAAVLLTIAMGILVFRWLSDYGY